MTVRRRKPGEVRDAIVAALKHGEAQINDIHAAVEKQLGSVVARSSVRSYLRLNAGSGSQFARTGRGRYRLRG